VLPARSPQLRSALSTAFAVGARLCRPDAATAAEPGAAAEWLDRAGITVLHVTAPWLRALATLDPAPRLPMLRYVFVDGPGDLTAHDVELVRRMEPSCRIVGTYRCALRSAAGGLPRARHMVAGNVPTAAAGGRRGGRCTP
jgi:non-ribosomal peptide synthetase component F